MSESGLGSHLLQMRGLKPGDLREYEVHSWSHLLQMRGLKLYATGCTWKTTAVASFTDAWIETIGAGRRQKRAIVASFTDAWIET